MSEMETKANILVVEDEEAIQRGLCDVLAYNGFEPTGAVSGEEGLEQALSERYDLVILDLMLPGMSGYDVCERIRSRLPRLPVLMLTARGSEDEILEGFERGADDYVTKPFSLQELLARVKALLRRSGQVAQEAPERFAFGDWQIDAAAARATRGSEQVELSQRELAILGLFVREAGRIVSRRTLLHDVWGFEHPDHIETRTVDMQIGKLRKKVDSRGTLIATVRGAGYRYDPPGS